MNRWLMKWVLHDQIVLSQNVRIKHTTKNGIALPRYLEIFNILSYFAATWLRMSCKMNGFAD